jgi:hypothetical protein
MSARRNASHRLASVASGLAAVLALADLAGCAPSLAPGTHECVGFPAEVCQNQVVDLEQEGQGHDGVAGYRFVCTTARCDATAGKGIAAVVFGDGTRREGGFGYEAAAEAPTGTDPPLAVAPQCLGVPESWCTDFARTAAAEAIRAGGTVAGVSVACRSTCTEAVGKGETRVTMADGRVIQSGWEYLGSGPADGPQGGEP